MITLDHRGEGGGLIGMIAGLFPNYRVYDIIERKLFPSIVLPQLNVFTVGRKHFLPNIDSIILLKSIENNYRIRNV